MKLAGRLAPRRQLSGSPLPPELPLVAAAIATGAIGEDHLPVISPRHRRVALGPSYAAPRWKSVNTRRSSPCATIRGGAMGLRRSITTLPRCGWSRRSAPAPIR
jgi:hypothetical protein